MNFGDILDEWDKKNAGAYVKDEETPEDRIDKRHRLLRKKPDAILDLHSLTQDEAWDALDDFFNRSRSMGFAKVLIIHGKGNHSEKEGILKEVSRKFIELCPFAGASGRNSSHSGGNGATWVLLKP